MKRRAFLLGLLAAPAIVRADSLMQIPRRPRLLMPLPKPGQIIELSPYKIGVLARMRGLHHGDPIFPPTEAEYLKLFGQKH
ncbi:MAG: hypothetical protein AAGI03_09105 [Pseudomonadota bacterium]